MGIVDEIIKIMGGPPARIFIEMARENLKEEQKKRTTSRKEQLKALYAAAKKTAREWEKQISKQETADLAAQLETKEEADLRAKKAVFVLHADGALPLQRRKDRAFGIV